MRPALRGLAGRTVVRALERGGFIVKRIKGSNHILAHQETPTRRTIVPVHAGKPVKPGTLRSILKQAQLTEDQFEALL